MRKHKTGQLSSFSAGCVFDDVPIAKLQQMLELHAEEKHTQIAFAGIILSIRTLRRVVLSTPRLRASQKESRAEVSALSAHPTGARPGSSQPQPGRPDLR